MIRISRSKLECRHACGRFVYKMMSAIGGYTELTSDFIIVERVRRTRTDNRCYLSHALHCFFSTQHQRSQSYLTSIGLCYYGCVCSQSYKYRLWWRNATICRCVLCILFEFENIMTHAFDWSFINNPLEATKGNDPRLQLVVNLLFSINFNDGVSLNTVSVNVTV